jgi:putative MATE family efflux protein
MALASHSHHGGGNDLYMMMMMPQRQRRLYGQRQTPWTAIWVLLFLFGAQQLHEARCLAIDCRRIISSSSSSTWTIHQGFPPTTTTRTTATPFVRNRNDLYRPDAALASVRSNEEEVSNDNDNNDNDESSRTDNALLSTRGGGNFFGRPNKSIMAPLPGRWPCNDALDRRLWKISLPVIGNYAIQPLIGAIDLFWVNYLTQNPLAVAGQAAANQVFGSIFWLTSFLPNVTAMLISKASAAATSSSDESSSSSSAVQDAVAQALLVGTALAAISSAVLLAFPDAVLKSVLVADAPALQYARPYLLVRALSFIPSIISLVGFSAFRGVLDTVTPIKITLLANAFHIVLDPLLIFSAGWGVTGAAVATLTAEVVSAVCYIRVLWQRNMLRIPSFKVSPLLELLSGGAALQLRNVALNIAFLAVARTTQGLDQTGVAASAHAMAIQVFQVGGIVLLGLSTVAQTVVPNDIIPKYDRATRITTGSPQYANVTVQRLMRWGLILGTILGSLQVAMLPLIQRGTPIPAIRHAARTPALLASLYQVINGLVFIGEGVMIGTGSFMQLSLTTIVATVGLLWALQTFPPVYGLTGVWYGFGVFNMLRLGGVLIHQCVNGPLSPRRLKKVEAAAAKRR